VFVVTQFARDNANLSQRSIYDERYSAGLYDRSVPVLAAERDVLHKAMERVSVSQPFAQRISLFDFAYGTGRVINDWLERRARQGLKAQHDLHVVVYDVSSVGLRRGLETLCSAGYEPAGPVTWDPQASQGYIAGEVRKHEAGHGTSVVFVHGCEGQPPEVMRQLALAANDGGRYLLTTSWRSGLGHIASDDLRREYLRQLSELTLPLGEMILCLSSTGDLAELQPEWSKRLASGDIGRFPIEQQGDVVYHTELGQENFCHVFGTELNEYMKSITTTGQYWWIEGIRYPGEEFESREAEQANYRLVRQANQKKRGQVWGPDDYREFHTVAAFRSPIGPGCGDLGRA
jgi:hypothetical protein